MDGLVHVSELSWQHVNHPSEVVRVGQKVEIKVLDIDRNRERISLSIKQTTPDPWQAFSSEHEVGTIIEGTVIKTVPFGAFVAVGNGVEGLVHVSEIAMHRVESPELELSIGQRVRVKLTEMDEGRRRVSFSIKQALPEFSARQAGRRPAEAPPAHGLRVRAGGQAGGTTQFRRGCLSRGHPPGTEGTGNRSALTPDVVRPGRTGALLRHLGLRKLSWNPGA